MLNEFVATKNKLFLYGQIDILIMENKNNKNNILVNRHDSTNLKTLIELKFWSPLAFTI